jgi:hypothetical protein
LGNRHGPLKALVVLGLITALLISPLVLRIEAVLMIGLPGGLPLGTLLAALAMVSGAAIAFAAGSPGSWLRRISCLTMAAAVVWLPLGILLAGNPALSFVNDGSDSALFWRYTAVTVLLIILTWVWAAINGFSSWRTSG